MKIKRMKVILINVIQNHSHSKIQVESSAVFTNKNSMFLEEKKMRK